VHLLVADDARLTPHELRHLTVLDARPPGFRFIVNDGARCGALDVSAEGRFPCRIYERRPDDCRIVEPGSPCCLEARRLGRLGSSVEFQRRRAPPS
jgi:Fe-S-cluster containining protein